MTKTKLRLKFINTISEESSNRIAAKYIPKSVDVSHVSEYIPVSTVNKQEILVPCIQSSTELSSDVPSSTKLHKLGFPYTYGKNDIINEHFPKYNYPNLKGIIKEVKE
ncbi:MAG: hypothetical protein HRT73_02240 [Flavobacteriales bacterium]|nr:hypothetical protein [Flavobacteriales bacterium]